MNRALNKLQEVLNELDLHNAALISILLAKNVFTVEEFKKIKADIKPTVEKILEAKKSEWEELIEKEAR